MSMMCWLHCVLEALHVQGIEPAMVQLGNEIDPGMMLPHGGVGSGFVPLADLLSAGHDVVIQVFPLQGGCPRFEFGHRAMVFRDACSGRIHARRGGSQSVQQMASPEHRGHFKRRLFLESEHRCSCFHC